LQEIILKRFAGKLQKRELLVQVPKNHFQPARLHIAIFQEWIADYIEILVLDGEINPASYACNLRPRIEKTWTQAFIRF
jgi:hypothetical protein